jgi:extracellular factor (EF) 3-hydroxypalmitic acid methyl ester biosynthesis protein
MDSANQMAFGQEALVTCVSSQGAPIQAHCLRLTRQQVVFEIYGAANVLLLSEVLGEFKLVLRERTVYYGQAVVKNLVTTGAVAICEAALDEGWLDVDLFAALAGNGQLGEAWRAYLQDWHQQYQVRPEYKLHIADMQMFFHELRRWLDQVELGLRSAPAGRQPELEPAAATQVSASAIPHIDGLFEKFELLAADVEEDLRPLHRTYMKRQLHPLTLCSPFAQRTFTKPLGYAGDYEMVNMIGRNTPTGASLFAKVVDAWFLHQPPARAHRNRIDYLTQRLGDETVRAGMGSRPARVFNLACGPALEVQQFLRDWSLSDRADFMLLDFNQETLDHASAVLEKFKRQHVRATGLHYVKKSVQQLLKEAVKVPERPAETQYDLVYCAGLFDYLADSVCRRLVDVMYHWLAPGGLLLVTNVDTSNPLRQGMDYLLDWRLVYRTAAQALGLRPAQAPPEAITVKSDATGVNLFIEVRKPDHA